MKLGYYFRIHKQEVNRLIEYLISNNIQYWESACLSFEKDFLIYAYLDEKDRTNLKLTFEIKNMLRI